MVDVFWFVLPGLTAAALTLMLTPAVSRLALSIGAVDMPGERKVHSTPVPRLGGLAVVASIGVVLATARLLSAGRWQLPAHLATGIVLGLLPILLVSVADDIKSVAAHKKLAVHILGASIAVSLGISLAPDVHLFGAAIHLGSLAVPLSILWIVGVTNAFNIIDGLDGLSAGLALISALSIAAVFALVNQPGMAGVSLVLAGGLAGFLPYNVHPARLFLGDTGATAIGFCLAAFALRGGSTLSSGFAVLLPVFILGLPIADTLITMLRRTLHRLEHHRGGVFVADRNHIHHRLLALGMDHGKAVLILYAAATVLASGAFISIFLSAREAALMVAALLLAGLVGVQRLGYDEFAFIRRGALLRVYDLPVFKRGFFIVFVDLALAFAAAYVAVGLKTDQWAFSSVGRPVLQIATTLAPITIVVFSWCGMYRGSWKVAGLDDLTRVLLAVAATTAAGAFAIGMFSPGEYSPSVLAIYGVVSLLLTASVRASYVILERTTERSRNQGTLVLIYGAGRRGAAAVDELFQNRRSNFRPVGFIDDDVDKRGKIVRGLPIIGTRRDLEVAVRDTGARAVLISSERIAADRVNGAAATCRRCDATLLTLDISVKRLGPRGRQPPQIDASTRLEVPGPPDSPQPSASRASSVQTESDLCPSCRSSNVHRSKARTLAERIRKIHTDKRLYRCQACGWRGWTVPLEFGSGLTGEAIPVLHLESLDVFDDCRRALPKTASR